MLLNIFLSLPVILFSGQVKEKGGRGRGRGGIGGSDQRLFKIQIIINSTVQRFGVSVSLINTLIQQGCVKSGVSDSVPGGPQPAEFSSNPNELLDMCVGAAALQELSLTPLC